MELHAAAKVYLNAYIEYVLRICRGDYNALIDSPIISLIVQHMLHYLPADASPEEKVRKCGEYPRSAHFASLPYRDIEARAFATLKAQVRAGAYTNREAAIQRLSGFFYDVKHIATYAPYYANLHIVDGSISELRLRDGTRAVRSEGFNAAPAGFDAFTRALRRLIGDRPLW